MTAPSCSGLRLEKIGPQQRRRHLGVHGLAGVDEGAQRHVAFDGDQGADALARQRGGGVGQLVGDRVLRVVAEAAARRDSGPAPSDRAAVPAGK